MIERWHLRGLRSCQLWFKRLARTVAFGPYSDGVRVHPWSPGRPPDLGLSSCLPRTCPVYRAESPRRGHKCTPAPRVGLTVCLSDAQRCTQCIKHSTRTESEVLTFHGRRKVAGRWGRMSKAPHGSGDENRVEKRMRQEAPGSYAASRPSPSPYPRQITKARPPNYPRHPTPVPRTGGENHTAYRDRGGNEPTAKKSR